MNPDSAVRAVEDIASELLALCEADQLRLHQAVTDAWCALVTDKGRRLADRFRPAVHAAERPWLESLDEAERRRLLALLGKVQAHLLKPQQ